MKIIQVSENIQKFEGDWRNLFEVCELIQYAPWAYIGKSEITALWHYLRGYEHALRSNKIDDNSFPRFYWFSTWIRGRIETQYDLSASWKMHLLDYCDNNEKKALEEFFILLEEFKNSIPEVEVYKIDKEHKTLDKSKLEEYWIDIYERTSEILIFNLPPSKSYWSIYVDNNGNEVCSSFELDRDAILKRISYEQLNWQILATDIGREKLLKLSLLKSRFI